MIQIQSKRTTFFSLITATCNSNVSLQYPPWIKCKGHEIDFNDRQSKKLLIVNHILLISTTGKVERLVKVKNSSCKILSANCWSTVGWQTVGQLWVDSWLTDNPQLADCWPTANWQFLLSFLPKFWPTVGCLSANRWPTMGWLLANWQFSLRFRPKFWLTVGQQSVTFC